MKAGAVVEEVSDSEDTTNSEKYSNTQEQKYFRNLERLNQGCLPKSWEALEYRNEEKQIKTICYNVAEEQTDRDTGVKSLMLFISI